MAIDDIPPWERVDDPPKQPPPPANWNEAIRQIHAASAETDRRAAQVSRDEQLTLEVDPLTGQIEPEPDFMRSERVHESAPPPPPPLPPLLPEIPDPSQKLKPINVGAAELVSQANKLVITDQASLDAAGQLLSRIKKAWKGVDDKRKEWVDPLNKTVKRINEIFAGPLQSLKDAENHTKRVIDQYQQAEQRRKEEAARIEREKAAEAARQEAIRKLEEQKPLVAAAGPEAVAQLEEAIVEEADRKVEAIRTAPVVTTAAPRAAGTTTAKVWDYEVTDLSQVPREYLMLDDKKIRNAVIHQDIRGIAGLRIFQKDQIRGSF
jgi:hypothetical protein